MPPGYFLLELSKLFVPQLDREVIGNGLDGQFIVESETKIQGLKSGTEGLTRSLQLMSSLLKDKSNPLTSKFQSEIIDAGKLATLNDQSSEVSFFNGSFRGAHIVNPLFYYYLFVYLF